MNEAVDFPPGFVATAFWFFPDWGSEDLGSKHGFKEPFWMKEPTNKEKKVTITKNGEIYNAVTDQYLYKCDRCRHLEPSSVLRGDHWLCITCADHVDAVEKVLIEVEAAKTDKIAHIEPADKNKYVKENPKPSPFK